VSADGPLHGAPDRRVIVDREAEADDRLAYVLEHIDAEFVSLRSYIDAAVESLRAHIDEAHVRHTARMVKDSDVAKPYWVSGSEHISRHWWGRFSQRFTMAVLMALLAVLLAVSTYIAARLGVIK
jgi:hypothetical protein